MIFRRRLRAGRGFTLIELMIVIAIIGILAAILTPVMIRARFKTYHTACVQNERNIASALELYAIESRSLYPPDLTMLTVGPKPFIQSISVCPSNGDSYVDGYTSSDDHTQYVLKCPGVHENQLVGLVDDTYPQAVNGQIYQYHAP
jgi:prepilin-type N-terminal cleavage/methylation domain-containing protein